MTPVCGGHERPLQNQSTKKTDLASPAREGRNFGAMGVSTHGSGIKPLNHVQRWMSSFPVSEISGNLLRESGGVPEGQGRSEPGS